MALNKTLEEMEIITGFEGSGSPYFHPMNVELLEEDGEAYLKAPRDALLDKQTLNWMNKELDLFQCQIDAGKPQDPNPASVRPYSFVEAFQLMVNNHRVVVKCVETKDEYRINENNQFISVSTNGLATVSVGTIFNCTFIKV